MPVILLHAATGTIRRRSLVLLISDFITGDGWERPLARLVQRHEVVAIRLVDPLERELPDVGVIVVEDAETGEQVLVDTSDPTFNARVSAEYPCCSAFWITMDNPNVASSVDSGPTFNAGDNRPLCTR